jgi:hypothetical protein
MADTIRDLLIKIAIQMDIAEGRAGIEQIEKSYEDVNDQIQEMERSLAEVRDLQKQIADDGEKVPIGQSGYGQSVRDRAAQAADTTIGVMQQSGVIPDDTSDEDIQKLHDRLSKQAEAQIRESDREAAASEKSAQRESEAQKKAADEIVAARRKLYEENARLRERDAAEAEKASQAEAKSQQSMSDEFVRRAVKRTEKEKDVSRKARKDKDAAESGGADKAAHLVRGLALVAASNDQMSESLLRQIAAIEGWKSVVQGLGITNNAVVFGVAAAGMAVQHFMQLDSRRRQAALEHERMELEVSQFPSRQKEVEIGARVARLGGSASLELSRPGNLGRFTRDFDSINRDAGEAAALAKAERQTASERPIFSKELRNPKTGESELQTNEIDVANAIAAASEKSVQAERAKLEAAKEYREELMGERDVIQANLNLMRERLVAEENVAKETRIRAGSFDPGTAMRLKDIAEKVARGEQLELFEAQFAHGKGFRSLDRASEETFRKEGQKSGLTDALEKAGEFKEVDLARNNLKAVQTQMGDRLNEVTREIVEATELQNKAFDGLASAMKTFFDDKEKLEKIIIEVDRLKSEIKRRNVVQGAL